MFKLDIKTSDSGTVEQEDRLSLILGVDNEKLMRLYEGSQI